MAGAPYQPASAGLATVAASKPTAHAHELLTFIGISPLVLTRHLSASAVPKQRGSATPLPRSLFDQELS